jgi:hypothetical protein
MKIRGGLVSNSSSSSFIVAIEDLTSTQLDQIENHIEVGKKFDMDCCHPGLAWSLKVIGGTVLRGKTSMDNFDMYKFMKLIGIDMSKVEMEKYG